MKTLSVLLTFGLVIGADALAAHLKRRNALPANTNQSIFDIRSTGTVTTSGFQLP